MAMSSLSGSQRNVICGVCQDVYRSPRFLPCHHTFCLYCIEGLARNHGQRFPCPQCRKPTQLPPEGALGFQVNFYITEEELELARKGPGNIICPDHAMEPLRLFCVQCDSPICLICKLTDHDHHKTEDLSKTAKRCADELQTSRQRVEKTLKFLTKRSAQAHDDVKASKQKATLVEEQIKIQGDLLKTRIDKCIETAIRNATEISTITEQQLAKTASTIQENLTSVTQLSQRVNHSLQVDSSDADKVRTEKEMREGHGNAEKLRASTECVPDTTVRPGLHCDFSITDEALLQYLGTPVHLSMRNQAVKEVIKPIVQLKRDQSCPRIHSLLHYNSGLVRLCVGGLSPKFDDAVGHFMTYKGTHLSGCGEKIGKCTFKAYEGDGCFKSKFSLGINAKAKSMFRARYLSAAGICNVERQTVRTRPFRVTYSQVQSPWSGKLINFDALTSGVMFATIEEVKVQEQTKEVVRVYKKCSNRPVATYTPPEDSFFPMDVCFWHKEDETKLLIADWNNDAIHVVDTSDNQLRFQRYLAAGSGHLVKPTALNVDDQGRVWIGCDNGWVLRCDKINSDEAYEESACALATDSASSLPEELMVGNSSPSQSTSAPSDASSQSDMLVVDNASNTTEDELFAEQPNLLEPERMSGGIGNNRPIAMRSYSMRSPRDVALVARSGTRYAGGNNRPIAMRSYSTRSPIASRAGTRYAQALGGRGRGSRFSATEERDH